MANTYNKIRSISRIDCDGTIRSEVAIVCRTETGDLNLVPSTLGDAGDVLTSNGSGGVSFQSTLNVFDQSLNTTDSPTFAGITVALPFAQYFCESNATKTFAQPVVGTFTKILGTTTPSTENIQFSHTNNRLTYNGTKSTVFVCQYQVSLKPDANIDSQWEIGISLDSSATPILSGRAHIHSVANSNLYFVSGFSIVRLTTNQFIEIFIANNTNNTVNCTVEDMTVLLTPLLNV